MEEYQLEIENRIKNLIWTVCGDYELEARPDVEGFLKSKEIALYDGIKQGAFAKYFDKEALSMYLVKKLFVHGDEGSLLYLTQMCIQEAVENRIVRERMGVAAIRQKACQDILEVDFDQMVKSPLGRLKIAVLKEKVHDSYVVSKEMRRKMDMIYRLREASTTTEVIKLIDQLYNLWVEPDYEKQYGTLEQILAVTVEELTEYSWKDFLSEDMYEDALTAYLEKVGNDMTASQMKEETEKEAENEDLGKKRKIQIVDEEALKKVYSYVELNFGRTFLSALDEKKVNFQFCKGIHGDCGLFFTDGILQNPVTRNYQYEYARKQKEKNKYAYYDNHRIVKHNIGILTDILKKAMVMRDDPSCVLSDRGMLLPARLWRVGRTWDAGACIFQTSPKLFQKEDQSTVQDFVVDVLIDASGSQRPRQEQVVLQAYMIMQALSNVKIPTRVMSFCTFWDHTILQRYREYDDPGEANERIFEFTTSSNNRDGLAIRAVSAGLLEREEEKKILIILSDGRPYDVILNRPGARNPQPYQGVYAIKDTGFEVRRLRNAGVLVLGVFAGEEKDLEAEKKIFGKDFAYIRDISNFSKMVGRFLKKQLEENG